jgi:hypothetical protein
MLALPVFPGPSGGRPGSQKRLARGRVNRRRKLVPGQSGLRWRPSSSGTKVVDIFFPKQAFEKEVARGRVSRRRNLVPGWSSFEIMRLQAASRLSRKIIGPTVWQSLGPWRIEKHTIKKSTHFIQPWCKHIQSVNQSINQSVSQSPTLSFIWLGQYLANHSISIVSFRAKSDGIPFIDLGWVWMI